MIRFKEGYGKRIEKIRGQFFEVDEMDRIFEVITKMAADSGVKINASRPVDRALEVPAAFSAKYAQLSYELVVEAGYHHLAEFINSAEASPKNFVIQELQIMKGEKTSNAQQATIVLTAFIKSQKTP